MKINLIVIEQKLLNYYEIWDAVYDPDIVFLVNKTQREL